MYVLKKTNNHIIYSGAIESDTKNFSKSQKKHIIWKLSTKAKTEMANTREKKRNI